MAETKCSMGDRKVHTLAVLSQSRSASIPSPLRNNQLNQAQTLSYAVMQMHFDEL